MVKKANLDHFDFCNLNNGEGIKEITFKKLP